MLADKYQYKYHYKYQGGLSLGPVRAPRHKTTGTLLKGWLKKISIKEKEFCHFLMGGGGSCTKCKETEIECNNFFGFWNVICKLRSLTFKAKSGTVTTSRSGMLSVQNDI